MFIWNQFHFASFFFKLLSVFVALFTKMVQNWQRYQQRATMYILLFCLEFLHGYSCLFFCMSYLIFFIYRNISRLYPSKLIQIEHNNAVSEIGWISCCILKFCIFSHKNILEKSEISKTESISVLFSPFCILHSQK